MTTFTVTFTDQHSNTAQFTNITAYSKQAALWFVIANQVVQAQISAKLNQTDTLTVTVTQP